MKSGPQLTLFNSLAVLAGGIIAAVAFHSSLLQYSPTKSDNQTDEFIVFKAMLFVLFIVIVLSGLVLFVLHFKPKRALAIIGACIACGLLTTLIAGTLLTMGSYRGACDLFGPNTGICEDEKSQAHWPTF